MCAQIQLGASDYMMKPVDPDFLVRYVHGVNGCIHDQLPGGIDFAVRNR